MGEKAPGHGELPARHGDRAMMEVDAEREIDRVLEHAERLHVVGERGVAKAGALLGGRDRLVDRDRRIVGEEPHEAQDLAQRLARLVAGEDQVGDGNGAGIDEGIARDAALAFELDDGVERAARRLAADAPPQPVADLAERERQREHLRDALDRERHVAVAARRDVAVGVDHGEAERLGSTRASSGI